MRKEKMKSRSLSAVLFLAVLLSIGLITNLSSAQPSTRLAVTVKTDKASGQVWLDVFVEGENITTPGFAPLS
ncbi:MAG: hypothetical protein WCC63_03125, partial [Candidatus Bathyarchaeia archaeon]